MTAAFLCLLTSSKRTGRRALLPHTCLPSAATLRTCHAPHELLIARTRSPRLDSWHPRHPHILYRRRQALWIDLLARRCKRARLDEGGDDGELDAQRWMERLELSMGESLERRPRGTYQVRGQSSRFGLSRMARVEGLGGSGHAEIIMGEFDRMASWDKESRWGD